MACSKVNFTFTFTELCGPVIKQLINSSQNKKRRQIYLAVYLQKLLLFAYQPNHTTKLKFWAKGFCLYRTKWSITA